MQNQTVVSIVLPCLNEAEGVGPTVRKGLQAIEQGGWSGEVIVVDNASDDGSAQEAAEAGAVVVNEPSRGYGQALRAGFSAAQGKVVVMADADGTYDLSFVPVLVRSVLSGEGDIVIGSRFGTGHEAGSMPFLHKHLGTPLLSSITRLVTGIKVKDSQSGFRAFSRDALRRLGLQSAGMELASEILLKAKIANLRVTEIPTGYKMRAGESKLSPLRDAWRHIVLLALWGPHLFFVLPGLAAMLFGLVLTLLMILQNGRIQIGSFRWEPVYFSTILLGLGFQAILLGMVLLSFYEYAPAKWRSIALKLLDPSRLLNKGFWAAGVVLLGIILELILVMFPGSFSGAYRLPLSSFAQDCLLLGGTLGMFIGAISALISSNRFNSRR